MPEGTPQGAEERTLESDEPSGHEQLTEHLGPEQNGGPPAIIDTLREQYASATSDRRKILEILPARFGGNLAARYQPIDWELTRKRTLKVARALAGGSQVEAELELEAATIADACESILVRTKDGGPWVELHETVEKFRAGGPVRFDQRLCEALGIEDTERMRQREIVRLVFKNEAALNNHYTLLDGWLREAIDVEDEDLDEEGDERPT